MDYEELVAMLKEFNENLIGELCADDILICDALCGTGDCIVVQATTAITDLLARAEAAEARAEKAERERDAAVKELNEVAEAVDGLSDFIDEQVHPLVSYDIYTALRENADAISVWQYESEWRGQEEE